MLDKICTKCHKNLPIESFTWFRGKPMARCRPCRRDDNREWSRQTRKKNSGPLDKFYPDEELKLDKAVQVGLIPVDEDGFVLPEYRNMAIQRHEQIKKDFIQAKIEMAERVLH